MRRGRHRVCATRGDHHRGHRQRREENRALPRGQQLVLAARGYVCARRPERLFERGCVHAEPRGDRVDVHGDATLIAAVRGGELEQREGLLEHQQRVTRDGGFSQDGNNRVGQQVRYGEGVQRVVAGFPRAQNRRRVAVLVRAEQVLDAVALGRLEAHRVRAVARVSQRALQRGGEGFKRPQRRRSNRRRGDGRAAAHRLVHVVLRGGAFPGAREGDDRAEALWTLQQHLRRQIPECSILKIGQRRGE